MAIIKSAYTLIFAAATVIMPCTGALPSGSGDAAAAEAIPNDAVPKDSVETIKFQALELKDPQSMYIYATWLVGKDSTLANPEKGWQMMSDAAVAGQPDAILKMADGYAAGNEYLKRDSAGALDLYRLAFAKKGEDAVYDMELKARTSPLAAIAVAQAYHKGKGVRRDVGKAMAYYHTAASQGSKDVFRQLGSLNYYAKDKGASMKWYRRGAENGDAVCAYWFGKLMFETESGNEMDAFEYVRQGAEAGLGGAYYTLADCYFTGKGTDADNAKGMECLTKAAESGTAEAQWDLAMRLAEGKGVQRDLPMAFYWLSVTPLNSSLGRFKSWASDIKKKGGQDALYAFTKGVKGVMEDKPELVTQSLDTLSKLDRQDGIVAITQMRNLKASAKDYKKLQKELKNIMGDKSSPFVKLYASYYVLPLKKDKAPSKIMSEFLDECSKAGIGIADEMLGRLYWAIPDDEDAKKTAIAYLEKALSKGAITRIARSRIAECYEKGEYVKKDLSKAKEILSGGSPSGSEYLEPFIHCFPE